MPTRPKPHSSYCALLLLSLSLGWVSCSAEDGQGSSLEGLEDLATSSHTVSSLRSPCLDARETLWEYADRCKDAIGVEMPGFQCNEGSTPGNQGTVFGKEQDVYCDAPNVLTGECDPRSKFQVLRRGVNPATGASDGIYIVANCRKKDQADNVFMDVAMIAHNKNNGATCFFQSDLVPVSGTVVAPRLSQRTDPSNTATYYLWKSPADTASGKCIGCHDNGPFLRSPYLGQLAGKGATVGVWLGGPETPLTPDKNYLPGTKQSEQYSWNNAGHLYRFVGTDFQSWKTYSVDVGGECSSCHRLALSTNYGAYNIDPIGTARDYGVRSTASGQTSKNHHGPDSPIWMRSGDISFDQTDYDSANKIATCADWIASGRPSSSTPPGICRDFLIGQGNTCSPSSPQVVGGEATRSFDTRKKAKSSVEVGGVCVAGQPCETGFPYLTSLHGPFFQRSDPSIPIDSTAFHGAYVRTFINSNSQWAFEAVLDALDLPPEAPSPGQPGGTIEAINYSRVASIFTSKQCTQNGLSLTVTGSTPLSSSKLLGNRETLAILGTLIGNVSPNTAVGASRLWVSQVGPDNLLQQYHAAQPTFGRGVPSWFSAGAFVHSCPSWNASNNFAAKDVSTSDDTQLVSSSLASKVICYLTGVGGNWAYTVPDPSTPGASIQAYAQIYVGQSNDIRLKVFAPDRVNVPVTASASCLRVDP